MKCASYQHYLELLIQSPPHLVVLYVALAVQPHLNIIKGCVQWKTFLENDKQ